MAMFFKNGAIWKAVATLSAALLVNGIALAADVSPPGMTDTQKAAASKKQSDGYTLENAGGAIAIVGGLALVGGLVWGIVDSSNHKSASAHVTPVVSPGYGGVALDGAF